MTTSQANAAVLRLFEAYFDRVYCFVRRSTDPATAEEVAQDVFIRLLSRANIETRQVSVSYLIKIADNMLKRRHRRSERSRGLVAELARNVERATDARTGSERDDHRSVLTAFDRLSSEEQDAVRMIVCEGLSYRDAAASLGVRVTTVNNWKHRGIQRLREHIRAEEVGAAQPAAARRRGGDAGRDRRGEGQGAGRVAPSRCA